jgi:DNA polymerase-3 subunit chi
VIQVAFHSGVTDKIGYACRLLRKACRQGARVRVVGRSEEIDLLDRALWTFDAHDFVPHLRWRAGAPVRPALARTPLWLTSDTRDWPAEVPPAKVLVNLGVDAVDQAAGYERVIEIVCADEDERRAGQARWRAYKGAGHALEHHPAASE